MSEGSPAGGDQRGTPAPVRRRPPVFDDSSPYVDRFGLLLIVTVVTIVLLSLIDVVGPNAPASLEISSLVATVAVVITLLLALRASGLARRWQRWADAFVVVGLLLFGALIALQRVVTVPPVLDSSKSPPLLAVVLAVVAPIVVVRRLLQHREVHNGTLLGAVCAYLLIPVAYFYVLLTINGFQGTAVFGSVQPTTSFMYFSLTTLSTVGYGDLVPVSSLARLLATSEAILGQVYLVTFVAMLVGLAASRWRDSR